MIQKILKILLTLCGAVFIGTIAFFSLSGMLRIVLTNSMAPTFRAGDVLLIDPHPAAIQPGTVISYQQDGKIITHRVIGIENGQFITQGDNADSPDPWTVTPGSVVGVPFLHIPFLGHAILFIRQPIGWLFVTILPAVLIVVGEMRKIYQKSRREKQHVAVVKGVK